MTMLDVLEPRVLAAEPQAIQGSLERLATLRAPANLVVTAYVRLEVNDRIRNRFRIAVRDAGRAVRMAVDQPGIPHPDREAILRDMSRIEQWLSNTNQMPQGPGMALFACEGLELFEAVPLPRVHRTRVLLADRPCLAEALTVARTAGRIVAALLDRAHARFFEMDAFGVRELPAVITATTRGGKYHSDRQDSPGWGEQEFHNRIREERHRHAAAVAEELTRVVNAGPCLGIVLAGPARTVADQWRFLPRSLAARVLGTAKLNPTSATPAEVRAAALAARLAWERRGESSLLADLEDAVGAGWAVTGSRAALRALTRGQARVLLVAPGADVMGYRCGGTGRLVAARDECHGEGNPLPVASLSAEAIEEAFRQHLEVVVLEEPDAARRIDGLAALLRFR
jgi:peptide subunit release factor 1 (eRF1)